MGLDLTVEAAPKHGYEREWRRLLERSFADEELSEADVARFQEISIPGYASIGAPRVGHDPVADEWIIRARQAGTPEQVAAVLKEFDGFYVVRLAACDGVPKYSNGGLYEGADETSFRGSFLNDCKDVISKKVLQDAWNHKFPEQAVAYGKTLLAAADVAEAAAKEPQRHRTLLSRMGLTKESEPAELADQLDIIRSAGRWFLFWGQRGHAIRAWF